MAQPHERHVEHTQLTLPSLQLALASSHMSALGRRAVQSLLLLGLVCIGCTDPDEACDRGATRKCFGTDGCRGEQKCQNDSSTLGACMCDSAEEDSESTTENISSGTTDGGGKADDTGHSATTDDDAAEGGRGGAGGWRADDALGGAADHDDSSSGGARNEDSSTGDTTGGDTTHGSLIYDGVGTAVAAVNNDFGISGSFYVRQDSYDDGILIKDTLTHSSVVPKKFNKGHDQACINGDIAQVIDGKWSSIWGVLIGLELDRQSSVWDATAHGVTGISFDLSGSVGDARLRVEARVHGTDDSYCRMIAHEPGETGSVAVSFAEFTKDCFAGDSGARLDPSQLIALEWIVMADDGSPSPVQDFCIERLSVVP